MLEMDVDILLAGRMLCEDQFIFTAIMRYRLLCTPDLYWHLVVTVRSETGTWRVLAKKNANSHNY